jgi:quercetin dioxygenase-like cupin family protein
MNRLGILAAFLTTLLAASVALHPAVGLTQAPPGVTVVYRTQFEAVAPAAPFEVLLRVNEVDQGAWQPPHTHPGGAFVTVLEGARTSFSHIVPGERTDPVTTGAGQTWPEPAWVVDEGGNTGAGRALFLVTQLKPKDLPETIFLPVESFRPGAPSPRNLHQARMEVTNLAGPLDLYHQLLELAPGAQLPRHYHPGPELGIVIEGEVTLLKATEIKVGAGESFVNAAGEFHGAISATDQVARVVTTHLVPAGLRMTFAAE